MHVLSRRRSFGLCLAVTAGALLASTGAAAAEATDVVSYAGLPSPLTGAPFQPDCTTNTQIGATYRHVTGPGAAPLGTGSLQMSVQPDSAADVRRSFSAADAVPLSQLSTFSAQARVADGTNPGALTMTIGVAEQAGGGYSLSAPLSAPTGSWTGIDAASATFSWYADGSTHTGTLSGFESDHPTVQLRTLAIDVVNCGSSVAEAWLDDLDIGIGGVDTVFDFEPPKPDSLTVDAAPVTVVEGRPVISSGSLVSGGIGLAGRTVSLWARTPGSPYREIESTTTDGDGRFRSGRLTPTATTAYQWRHPADDEYAAAVSGPATVHVKERVTLSLNPKPTLGHDAKEHAHGSVVPAKKGLKVTVFAARGHGPAQWVAHAKLDRRGRYSAAFALPRGHYTLYARAAGDAKNLAGSSAVHALRVK